MDEPIVYSVEAAARLLGVSRTKAYALVREGTLRTIPTGRRQVVPASAIEALLWASLSSRPPFLPPRGPDVDDNRVEIVAQQVEVLENLRSKTA